MFVSRVPRPNQIIWNGDKKCVFSVKSAASALSANASANVNFMSRLNFGKKLSPARRVWKSITSTVQKKLHKLKKAKSIKNTTKGLNTTLSKVFSRSRSYKTSPRIRLKKHTLTRPSSAIRIRHHNCHVQRNYAPVYIDELFVAPVTEQEKQHEKVVKKIEDKPKPSKQSEKLAKKRNDESLASSSRLVEQLQGVDERAEQFIARFKEEMRLQRQRSFGEYQEMLARGV